MAPSRVHSPTLMGVPYDILLKILNCLFEREDEEIDNGYLVLADWPIAILRSCRLLNIEAKKAMRARLNKCGLHYIFTLPPQATRGPDDVVFGQQIRFLTQHADCIKVVSVHNFHAWAGFSLHWFSNLEVFELHESLWKLVAAEDDSVYVGGQLKKDRLLNLYQHQFYDYNDWCYRHGGRPQWWRLIKTTSKGVDRSFSVRVVLELHVSEVGPWVRSLSMTPTSLQLIHAECPFRC